MDSFFPKLLNPTTKFQHKKKLALWKFAPLVKENVCNIRKMTDRSEEMIGHEVEIYVGAVVAPSFPPPSTQPFSLLVFVRICDYDF